MSSERDIDIVTFGEALGIFETTAPGRLRSGDEVRFRFAGAESNVAIGAARQGRRAAWISALGGDPMAAAIERELRAEGVRLHVRREPDRPTGMIVKVRRASVRTEVTYVRQSSAFATTGVEEFDLSPIPRARILHISGVTLGIGEAARQAVHRALDLAGENGVTVSFDVNFRSSMWHRDDARAVLRDVARRADIVFASPEEAAVLVEGGEPEDLARAVRALGPAVVAMKLGARGAFVLDEHGRADCAAVDTRVVDVVGAGDAFAAGFLCATLGGADAAAAVAAANLTAGVAISSPGDWEGLPTAAELCRGDFFAADVVR